MKIIEQFYFNKFNEAIELGNDEMAEEMLQKGSKLQRQREANSVAWLMFGFVVFTILSPFIHWWVIGWGYNL